MAYFGYIYDHSTMFQLHPELLKANTLVLECGDQTVNYISMAKGVYRDEDCGSLDLGLFNAHAEIQKWFESQGVEITQAELAQKIINREPVYHGKNVIPYQTKAQECYDKLAKDIYDRLNSRLKFSNYQYLLLAGGGGPRINPELFKRFDDLLDVRCPIDSQWLNAYGAIVMWKLKNR
jgi:hypothetical protein